LIDDAIAMQTIPPRLVAMMHVLVVPERNTRSVVKQVEWTANADHNAAKVLKKRGIAMILAGEIKAPKRKKAMRMAKKKQVGQDMSEPAEAILPTLETAASAPEPQIIAEETNVSREVGTTRFALWSTKRETPATRPQGV